jgi:DNA end-binding protein Ku
MPAGPALMLGTLRWANEIRPAKELNLPAAGDARLKDAELRMAGELIRKMAGTWQPQQFADRFSDAIRELVARKAAAGKAKAVQPLEEAPADTSNVIDLSELLRSSLRTRKRAASAKAPARAKKARKTGSGARRAVAKQARVRR